jgi:hypothetical protein
MSPLVKTKRAKDFKRFEAFRGLVEQKNVVFNSFLCFILLKQNVKFIKTIIVTNY